MREIFLSLGKELSEHEVQKMVEEAPGPINFTMFLTLLGQKMRETDPLDTLEQAFSCLGKRNDEPLACTDVLIFR